MTKTQRLILVTLRVALGWLFFYAGIIKVLNPEWTAKGFLTEAKTFTSFYTFLTGDAILPIINFLNEWGLTLLGASLILGLFVRVSAPLGMILMGLYYVAGLEWPYVGNGAYIVDMHIIYILILLFLTAMNVGHTAGLDKKLFR